MKTILSGMVLVLFLYSCTPVKSTGRGRTSQVEVVSVQKPVKA